MANVTRKPELTGPEIRLIMERLGMRSKHLAELAGFSVGHISRLRGGKMPVTKPVAELLKAKLAILELQTALKAATETTNQEGN